MGHTHSLAARRNIRTMKLVNPNTYKEDGYYEFMDAMCETHRVRLGYIDRYNGMYRAVDYREQNNFNKAVRAGGQIDINMLEARRHRRTQLEGFQILEHSIDKNGFVKAKKESGKLTEDIERWNKVYKYNLKAKMLNRGVLDIINDKVTYVTDTNMVEAVIPALVERMGKTSLRFSRNTLKSVVINAPITHLNRALLYGTSVEKVKLYEKTKEIGQYAFYRTEISEIELPETIRIIGQNAFGECRQLRRIHFNGKLNFLGARAFFGCASLEEIILPNGIEKIESGTFTGCGNLMHIFIPKSVKELTFGGLHGVNRACKIEIPEHLRRNQYELMFSNVVYY